MKKRESTYEALAQEYFLLCREKDLHPSLPGLALALGLTGRQELRALAAGTGRTAKSLCRAITQVEEANIQSLYHKDRSGSAKFILQSAFGYGEDENSGTGSEGEIRVSIEGAP